MSTWTSAEVDLTAVCSCVSLFSVEYDFRQQEKLFLEVLNRSANVDHAHHLNFSLLRRAILKKVTKSKVKSKKLCKTLFKWLPGKIQHVQTPPDTVWCLIAIGLCDKWPADVDCPLLWSVGLLQICSKLHPFVLEDYIFCANCICTQKPNQWRCHAIKERTSVS